MERERVRGEATSGTGRCCWGLTEIVERELVRALGLLGIEASGQPRKSKLKESPARANGIATERRSHL
jgi:hypothetical protein